MHRLPISCPFNFPNGNLEQKLSHIEVFICYQNIDAKKLNLHIYGIHLLNPYETVVSHLKCPSQVECIPNRRKRVAPIRTTTNITQTTSSNNHQSIQEISSYRTFKIKMRKVKTISQPTVNNKLWVFLKW